MAAVDGARRKQFCGPVPRQILRRAYGLLPRSARRRAADALIRLKVPSAEAAQVPPSDGRVTVAGLFSSPTGIGEGARLCAERLAEIGYRVGAVDLTADIGADGGLAFAHPGVAGGDIGGPLVVHLNPRAFQAALFHPFRATLGERKVIANWVWEAPDLPPSWCPAFRMAHEVWAPSPFVAEAVAKAGCRTPIRQVAYALRIPPEPRWDHAGGAGRGPTVLLVFAYESGFDRKNPIAGVEAFTRAFAPGDGATLIVKSRGRSVSGNPERRLAAAIAGRPDIVVRHGDLGQDAYDELLQSADVLLSLHRAEGFGLPLADAMLRGKPVVATAWSGNLAFMREDVACLVTARTCKLTDEKDAYRALDSVWADPDVDEAAAWLRRLTDPALRERIGRAARAHVIACVGRDSFAAAVRPSLGDPPAK
jgi:glycosyltransferase involved in cell wall biosynthesis